MKKKYLLVITIVLILLITITRRSKRVIIPEPEGTIILKSNSSSSQLLFEPVDIRYYHQHQVPWTPNYLDFDFGEEDEIRIYQPDSQNVHDTIVQRSIREKFNSLGNETAVPEERAEGIISEVRDATTSLPPRRRGKILEVLETIGNRNTPVINLNSQSEKQILKIVWDKVKGTESENELLKQLEDCHENGLTVCTTGVATRLMSVLFLDDPDNFPRTKGNLREEMLNKASVIREKFQDDDSKFKQKLFYEFEKDYKGILTKNEIEDELNSWIDHI